ncbi:MAG: UbiA family prenyltransferase [bacterium]
MKFFDYVFVLRPTLFLPVWTVYAAGYFAYHRFAPAGKNGATTGMAWNSIWLLAFLTLLMGSAYILNQICDRDTDARNHKLFLIAQHHIPLSAAWGEMIALAAAGLAAAVWHSPAMAILFSVIFLCTGIFYSVAPFQWKDRPFMGLFANAWGAVLIFTAGWWSVETDSLLALRHALPYALAVAAVYLYTTLLDVEGDAETNKLTFGVKFGWRATVFAGAILEGLAIFAAFWVSDPIILYPALIAAPFFFWATLKQRRCDVSRAIKFPILFLALAIGVKVWQYLLVLAFVFFFSKWYYQHRFGLKYPSLRAE